MTEGTGPGGSERPEAGWVVDAPLRSPSADQGLAEVFKQRYLLRLLVRREIGARYQASVLGMVWSYLNPASQLLIYWAVFGLLLGRDRAPLYPIHIFCGLIVVQFFVETLNAGTASIVRNQALVKKMAVPREMFPVATMLVSLIHMGPQLLILVGIVLVLGWTPTATGLLGFGLAVLIIMVLGTGLALIFSVANVFMRDIGSVVSIVSNVIRFGVPMIYPYSLVSERFGDLARYYLYNPIADAVLLVQQAFWRQPAMDRAEAMAAAGGRDRVAEVQATIPDYLWSHAWLSLGIAVVILFLGQWIFSRYENKIPDRLT